MSEKIEKLAEQVASQLGLTNKEALQIINKMLEVDLPFELDAEFIVGTYQLAKVFESKEEL